MNAANDQNRYIFGITGTVKEIVYPSKAILAFKFNGKEEKAILLVHKYLIDGAAVDEQKLMSDILKVGDVVRRQNANEGEIISSINRLINKIDRLANAWPNSTSDSTKSQASTKQKILQTDARWVNICRTKTGHLGKFGFINFDRWTKFSVTTSYRAPFEVRTLTDAINELKFETK